MQLTNISSVNTTYLLCKLMVQLQIYGGHIYEHAYVAIHSVMDRGNFYVHYYIKRFKIWSLLKRTKKLQ